MTFICNFFLIMHGFLLVSYTSFSSVQSLSRARLFATPLTAAHQASLCIINSPNLLKLMSIESVMSSNRLILCHPLLLPLSIFPASGSFHMSQLFTSGGQNIGVSASTSVLTWIFRTDFLQDGLVESPCSPFVILNVAD